MAALSRATSLLVNKSFHGRHPQRLCRVESCVLALLGFDGGHPYGQAIYQDVSIRSHPALTGTKPPQQMQSPIVTSLASISMTSPRLTVPAAYDTISLRLGNTSTPRGFLVLKAKASPLASSSYSDASDVDSTSQTPIIKHKKTFAGSRYKTHPDIVYGHKCLRSSIDDFFVYVLNVLTCGFQPALTYLGGVLLTISLSTILFVLWIMFFP
ncbi:hypothetical protein F4813DRAFT_367944 [Daldinia decipiens]|uniref:uncharacterized protein n=1 Tax=Daldinia decipiens TaxID=326647 RepID=UPI0020C2B0E2|nr:uncharacterized protein F4813DRAFT_367944 [Daldinia decipiens]KAI1655157.1 hypothetical protein F4813DRAFT_367944 [Daldinia decipiens]